MEQVLVRSADGQFLNMVVVEREDKLTYVVAVDSVDRMLAGLTEPVGCPSYDVVNKEKK